MIDLAFDALKKQPWSCRYLVVESGLKGFGPGLAQGG
jgi:hypothetical protein